MTLLAGAERAPLALFVAEQGARAREGAVRIRATIGRLSWKQLGLLIAAALIVVGAVVYWFAFRAAPPSYVTVAVTRGDVVTTISASGSVNPVVTVQVGTYVSGTIQTLACDYNTRVHSGQLCATIDPKPYEIIVEQDLAAVNTARAQLVKDQSNLAYTQINQKRYDAMLAQNAISRDAADIARNANNQALALTHLDAAQVAQKVAVLKAAQINLAYTNIVSPVSGTVVARNVTAGQTVAASFQTPTLFLIATDLTKMQVDTNVSESDIAGAHPGADASFTVDAFPDRTFRGKVAQVRQAPISVQNVITYDVVVTVDNPDLLLKPGMTATAKIVKAQARNVLRVPSQALRFTPTGTARVRTSKSARHRQQQVWVERNGKLIAVPVTVGLDDDSFAQIKSGELKPGDQVVLSVTATGTSSTTKSARTSALHL
jgi:HlyD family secretion protein